MKEQLDLGYAIEAATHLVLIGQVGEMIPDGMSGVVCMWTTIVQTVMPDRIRNSPEWREALIKAAGTGRDKERERLEVVMDWIWDVVLPTCQHVADRMGCGDSWRTMCLERTEAAAAAFLDVFEPGGVAAGVLTPPSTVTSDPQSIKAKAVHVYARSVEGAATFAHVAAEAAATAVKDTTAAKADLYDAATVLDDAKLAELASDVADSLEDYWAGTVVADDLTAYVAAAGADYAAIAAAATLSFTEVAEPVAYAVVWYDVAAKAGYAADSTAYISMPYVDYAAVQAISESGVWDRYDPVRVLNALIDCSADE